MYAQPLVQKPSPSGQPGRTGDLARHQQCPRLHACAFSQVLVAADSKFVPQGLPLQATGATNNNGKFREALAQDFRLATGYGAAYITMTVLIIDRLQIAHASSLPLVALQHKDTGPDMMWRAMKCVSASEMRITLRCSGGPCRPVKATRRHMTHFYRT